ncbi:MAG TPA: DUF4126 domain-containing protein [Candidatus Omnitrophota bacterium]|nr:DUF4126 domain-containing protein [Candidatus Omnitrophota bacterium]HRY85506.1 DUF4126 domain-containing protein [Candidatus Omnitrophota bacterium]
MPQISFENIQKFFTGPSQELLILTLAGWASGISLYLTAGLLGLCGHFGWIHLPGELGIFANPVIFSLAFIIFSIEFIADKVPYVDSVWDSVHTFIRPAGAIAIGFLAGSEHGPVIQTAYAMFAGTLTLNTHTAKAAERLAINTSPEPFSNIAASTAEQGLVVFMFWFFVKHPVLTCVIIIGLLVLAFLMIRLLWRFVKAVFGFGKKKENP